METAFFIQPIFSLSIEMICIIIIRRVREGKVMKLFGWIFMISYWSFIIILLSYCLYRVLNSPDI
jgi:hypothetical protein